MATQRIGPAVVAAAAVVSSVVWAAPAHAAQGWAAIASSPSREAADYSWSSSATQAATEAQAVQKCVVGENVSDCRVVASGPDCAAIAWDVDEPLNHAHGGVGATPEDAVAAAMAAAGPYANDPSVRCSWFPQPTLW